MSAGQMSNEMKFVVQSKDFGNVLSSAAKIVNAHTTVPILGNLLISADDGLVTVRVTDLELTLEQDVNADVAAPGSITVPARAFADYVSNLPSGLLEVSGSSTRASARHGRSAYDFHALPPEGYPPLPSEKRGAAFRLDGKAFSEAVEAVCFAASDDQARGQVLMGVFVELEGDKATFVATDGYKLAKWQGPVTEREGDGVASYIVPVSGLKEAERNMGGAEVVEVSIHGSTRDQMRFRVGKKNLVVRLVNGIYPDYRKVIPAKFDREVIVHADDLIRALRRTKIVSDERASRIRMQIEDQSLMLSASSDKVGNGFESIDAEKIGEDIALSLNAAYFIKIIEHVGKGDVALSFITPLSAVSIRSRDVPMIGSSQYIIMPLRDIEAA